MFRLIDRGPGEDKNGLQPPTGQEWGRRGSSASRGPRIHSVLGGGGSMTFNMSSAHRSKSVHLTFTDGATEDQRERSVQQVSLPTSSHELS